MESVKSECSIRDTPVIPDKIVKEAGLFELTLLLFGMLCCIVNAFEIYKSPIKHKSSFYYSIKVLIMAATFIVLCVHYLFHEPNVFEDRTIKTVEMLYIVQSCTISYRIMERAYTMGCYVERSQSRHYSLHTYLAIFTFFHFTVIVHMQIEKMIESWMCSVNKLKAEASWELLVSLVALPVAEILAETFYNLYLIYRRKWIENKWNIYVIFYSFVLGTNFIPKTETHLDRLTLSLQSCGMNLIYFGLQWFPFYSIPLFLSLETKSVLSERIHMTCVNLVLPITLGLQVYLFNTLAITPRRDKDQQRKSHGMVLVQTNPPTQLTPQEKEDDDEDSIFYCVSIGHNQW